MIKNQVMHRNLRCCAAYLATRMDRLQKVAWGTGKQLPDHLSENLSESEKLFFKTYVEALDSYSEETAVNQVPLDLTVDLMPPKELFIYVRC